MLNVWATSQAHTSLAVSTFSSCTEKISQGVHSHSRRKDGYPFVFCKDFPSVVGSPDGRAVLSSIQSNLSYPSCHVQNQPPMEKRKVAYPFFASRPFVILSPEDIHWRYNQSTVGHRSEHWQVDTRRVWLDSRQCDVPFGKYCKVRPAEREQLYWAPKIPPDKESNRER